MAQGYRSILFNSDRNNGEYQLDVHIRKKRQRPIFQAFGKLIYDVEWLTGDQTPIILLKIDGAKAIREASFYVTLTCHSHIVQTFGLVHCNPGSVMLLQECAPHGDLSERLQEGNFQPTEEVLCKIFEQITDALIFLADNGVVHGDLACRNVLVFESDATDPKKNLVKLTDFGLTRASSLYSVVGSSARTTMTIIPFRYAAPELLRDADSLNYSEKSDVYSMGVLMWEACSYGEMPYLTIDSETEIRRKKLNNERLARPAICGDSLWGIMNQCWNLNPEDRPDFRALSPSIRSISSELKRQRKASRRKQCKYCQKRFNHTEYESHQCNRASNDPVRPTLNEFHRQPINTSRPPAHTKILQKERIPMTNRNEQILIDLIPCEFCNKLYSINQVAVHQFSCIRNPNNRMSQVNNDTLPLLPTKDKPKRKNPSRFPCNCC